jgi:hypothetical protein
VAALEEAAGTEVKPEVVVTALAVFPFSWAAQTEEQKAPTMNNATNTVTGTNL